MRTLTFLFADLRDYTAFVEHHGDVAATTLIADYRRLVRGEVAKAKGAEVKTEGDSFYVVFEAASDAVRCAVSILREADHYSRDRPDRPMRVGIGIHAGEPQPHEGQYVGGAVIVAARLAQSAGAGELLVSEVVRALLPKGTAPAMTERTDLTLKGIADAPRAFAVSWAAAEPAASAAPREVSVEAVAPTDRTMLCPRVIGRDVELGALRALLEEATSGHGRTVLVAGEAGVGKSALLRTFVDQATGSGARVLRGECSEVEARRPFGPLIDAFVAASLPLPAELSQGGPGALPVAEVERYRVHGAFAESLADLAGNATVVVSIEDVHWADSATLELLPYLARKLRARRVLLLCTYRDDELHRLHPLRGTLAELKRLRLMTEVRLPRLGSDEVAAMIKETLRLGRAPTTAFREAIQERCEGNPFFIEEVLRTLVERGDLEYREGAWRRTKDVADLAIPDSVRDAVQQRLATLTPTARRILQVAAVIGQRFGFELLQRVTGEREGDLLDALREAIEAQIVVEEREGEEETYRFRHALTRESVLAELMRREQRTLHLAVAEAIEGSSTAPDRRAEELAYHFDGAGDGARAYPYHELAASQAQAAFAYSRALDHLERAIELAPQNEDEVGSLQLRLAGVALNALDLARAIRSAEAARASFRAAGETRKEARALSQLGLFRFIAGEQTAANRDLEDALALVEPLGPSVELAGVLAQLAWAAALRQDLELAIPSAERAIETAKAVGGTEAHHLGLHALGTALAQSETPERGLAVLRELIALTRDSAPPSAQRAYNNVIALLVWNGAAPAEVEANYEEWLEHSRVHRLRGDNLLSSLANRSFWRGDWDETLRLVEEGRGDAQFTVDREATEAYIVTAREGPSVGLPKHESAFRGRPAGELKAPQDIIGRAFSMTTTLSLAGQHRAAIEHAGPLIRQRAGHPAVDNGLTVAIWSAFELQDRTAAAELADAAGQRRSRWGHGFAECARAFGDGARSELAGDLSGALEHYGLAVRLFEERFSSPVISSSFARLRRADVLIRAARTAEARAEVETALAFWRRAKATWYLGQLRGWAAKRGIELAEAETTAAT